MKLDDTVYFEKFDISQTAGCLTPYVIDIPSHSLATPSTIKLQLLSATPTVAILNFIQVDILTLTARANNMKCVPAFKMGTVSADHSAHSLPGKYPPVVSTNTANDQMIALDGSGSHTHFFNPELDVIGKLTSVQWTETKTNAVISNTLRFTHGFKTGDTQLKLKVTDNACDSHEAVTTITVDPPIRSGVYCEYFNLRGDQNAGNINLASYLNNDKVVQFAHVVPSFRPNFFSSPLAFLRFVVRCTGTVKDIAQSSTISADTAGSGIVAVFSKSGAQLLRGFGTASGSISPAMNQVRIVYARTTVSTRASLEVKINGKVPLRKSVSHDVRGIIPVITGIYPSIIPVNGKGARLRITGFGLFPTATVTIGTSTVKVVAGAGGGTETELSLAAPVSNVGKAVQLFVTNSAGKRTSNSLTLTYKGNVGICNQLPIFDKQSLTVAQAGRLDSGQPTEIDWLRQPTSVAIGPDNRLYIGSMNGSVAVLGYDVKRLTVQTYCYANSLIDRSFVDDDGNTSPRSILGITFNPAHGDQVLPYVSTTTLNYWKASRISRGNNKAWRNGAIQRLKLTNNPSEFLVGKRSGVCLTLDTTILTGLPVGNGGSHSVNALQFNDQGDLLVAVGGNTNMGLPGVGMGSTWESPLSGSIIILPLSASPKLPVEVKYDGGNAPHTAKLGSNNIVRTFVTGLRNTFAMHVALDGTVYAVDQGPGCSLGGAPASCATFSASEYVKRGGVDAEEDWPSPFKGDEGLCSGTRREDKVLKITQGAFYGHANFARGECQWVDVLTGKTLDGKSVKGYVKPLGILDASVTSVVEYATNGRFCGMLKGRLVLSNYRGVSIHVMDRDGKQSMKLRDGGGTSFVEDVFGQLVFPRLTARSVDVYVPADNAGSFRAFGVQPRRLRRNGGVSVFVGGLGLVGSGGKLLIKEVWIGNSKCSAVKVESDGVLKCTAPGRTGAGGKLVDVRLVHVDGRQATLKQGVSYLNI